MHKTDLSHIQALFTRFDCNPKETKLYLQALKMGPASVQEIAKALRQNRVTVHSAVEQLIKKGFLYETRKGKKRLIVAEHPSVLEKIYEQKQAELRMLKPNIGYVTGLLQKIEQIDQSVPKVKLYEDQEGFRKMLNESLETKGEILVFSHVDLLSDIVEADYLEHYFLRRSQKKIHTRLLFPRCAFADRVEAKSQEYKIRIRYLPPEFDWQSGIFAWDDKIALLSYTKQRLVCTIIENPDIAHFYRHVIFELIWQMAETKTAP